MSDIVSEHERNLQNHGKRYLDSGACWNKNGGASDTFARCAMEPFECFPENGEYFDPHDQDAGTMRKCNPNNTPMGRCMTENICALRATDCPVDSSDENFDADDENCTYQRDKAVEWNKDEPEFTQFGSCYDASKNEYTCIWDPQECDESGYEVYRTPAETLAAGVQCDISDADDENCTYQRDKAVEWNKDEPEFTQFGSCYDASKNDYTCIWDPQECDESGYEVYKTPAETLAAGVQCDCSEVHVWGCEIMTRVMCAVTAEACNQEYTFMSPILQRSNRQSGSDGLDCRLCLKSNTWKPTSKPTMMPVPTTSVPTKSPTFSPTSMPVFKPTGLPTLDPTSLPEVIEEPLGSLEAVKEEKSDSGSNGALIGGVVGGGVVLVVLFGVLYMKLFRTVKTQRMENPHVNSPIGLNLSIGE
eukprot:CAMPEP_0194443978 /NCGR_PEP_ID=MMETSP0176-20130528/127009_1 /TAXON_ID=216777 /ORGANISM="Proboscia alata, Strain PI-D3" /LENGTH=416 /DNA_ID=CAMNT_0039270293 /DNA_START=81 /DNA_END=1330 /DNA_ORIENTATION=-